ncbi:MAG: helix-turn-helix transcriptional regulator [Flavobacteriaceae bacterium]|nr:helix-turn-helix transcriptional regulator [Flavobacteriaceae bacterium]
MLIGKKLKSARFEKNYTQEHMASVLNVSQKTYSNFENDITQPNINQLQQIANELDKSVLELLPDEKINMINNGEKAQQSVFATNHYNLPDKLVQQYEERIKDLQEQVNHLKKLLAER